MACGNVRPAGSGRSRDGIWTQSAQALGPGPVTHAEEDGKCWTWTSPRSGSGGSFGKRCADVMPRRIAFLPAPRRWTFRSRQVSWLTGRRARSAFPDFHPVTKSNGTLRSQLRGQLRLGDHHVRRPNSHLSSRLASEEPRILDMVDDRRNQSTTMVAVEHHCRG